MAWEDRPGGILIMSEHPPFVFKFKDALNMHIEAAQPALANCLHAKIYADILLNFTSKKVVYQYLFVLFLRFFKSLPHKAFAADKVNGTKELQFGGVMVENIVGTTQQNFDHSKFKAFSYDKTNGTKELNFVWKR